MNSGTLWTMKTGFPWHCWLLVQSLLHQSGKFVMLDKKLTEDQWIFLFSMILFWKQKTFFLESSHTTLSTMKTLHLFRLMLMLMDDKILKEYSSNQLSVWTGRITSTSLTLSGNHVRRTKTIFKSIIWSNHWCQDRRLARPCRNRFGHIAERLPLPLWTFDVGWWIGDHSLRW